MFADFVLCDWWLRELLISFTFFLFLELDESGVILKVAFVDLVPSLVTKKCLVKPMLNHSGVRIST